MRIRLLAVLGVALFPSIAMATPATAQPDGTVPGMDYTAVSGQPCGNRATHVFGLGPNGEVLACHWFQTNQDYLWDGPLSGPLMGVKNIGAPCTTAGASIAYAQSPDGYPLSCSWGEWGRI